MGIQFPQSQNVHEIQFILHFQTKRNLESSLDELETIWRIKHLYKKQQAFLFCVTALFLSMTRNNGSRFSNSDKELWPRLSSQNGTSLAP